MKEVIGDQNESYIVPAPLEPYVLWGGGGGQNGINYLETGVFQIIIKNRVMHVFLLCNSKN